MRISAYLVRFAALLCFAVLVSETCCSKGSMRPVLFRLAAASGPSLDGFDNQTALDAAISSFMDWFQREYAHHSEGPLEGAAVHHRSNSRPSQHHRQEGLPSRPLKVVLRQGGPSLRLGVFATETITAESPYLSIPHAMIIYKDTIEATRARTEDGEVDPITKGIGEIIKALLSVKRIQPPKLDAYQTALALFLLHERFIAKEKSYFYHYIRLLPTKHDTTEFYTDEELSLLNGTTLYRKTLSRKALLKAQFDYLFKHVFDVHSDVFPDVTLDDWRWVMGILESRMIWWEGQPHLVPMLDMVNCQQLSSRPNRIHSTFRRGSDAVTLAPITFQKGQQIFENYGQPNPTCFFYHGFVMQPNNKDCAEFDLVAAIPATTREQRIVKEKVLGALKYHRIDASELCVMSASMNQLLAAARIYAATSAASSSSQMPLRDPFSSPLADPAVERSAIVFAGKAINATLTSMDLSLEKSQPLRRRREAEEDALSKAAGKGKGALAKRLLATTSGLFRVDMIQKYLMSQRRILEDVKATLRGMVPPRKETSSKKTAKSKALEDDDEGEEDL